MSITSILLHLTQDPRNDARTETALNLAASHNARLIALYTIMPPQLPAYVMGYVPPELLERYSKEAADAANEAKSVFQPKADAAGVAFEWRQAEGMPHDIVSFHAHYADMVVVGQTAPDKERVAGTEGLPDELVLSAGRPILVTPYIGDYSKVGKSVLVAWNGTREAARAVHDALPFLQQASEVTIFGVDMPSAQHIPGADIATHLARHGIKPRVEYTVAPDIPIGDALLDAVSDYGCDMLVMGAYGHSRIREIALGGATRHILQHMTVPVLMSH
ncbi:MAG: universal stress protein [Minwuiales bacterium]|nr:universal stress protein [Minwuiales bacterium]